MADVQEQVEILAATLDCAVLVEDARHRPLWWSAQGEVDAVRSRTILQRAAPPAAEAVVTRLGLANAHGPVRTPAVPEADMAERWCVPLRTDRDLLGYLWVLDAGGKVTDADLDPIIDCAQVATQALVQLRPNPQERERRRSALLDRLSSARDAAALAELVDLENLPRESMVCVNAPGDAAGWTLPSGMSAHVQPPPAVYTSGPPVPLRDLALAVGRAADTVRALRAGALLGRPTWSDLGAWHLIVAAPDDLEPDTIHSGAGALLTPKRADLLVTARCVLDNGGDVTLSAEQLHIHRTTLYYRLEQIEKLTGVNLRLAPGRDDLHLALRLAAYRAAQ